MEQYIPKSALVAEIEKLEGKISDSSSYCNGWQHALRMLKLSLDTLETKEIGVDVGSPKGDYCVKVKYKIQKGSMTKQETIQVLQSIEERAIDFPNMTECDWVAIAAAKRHLQEEPVGNFEMALTEMIDNAQKCVVEPWAVAAQWKDYLVELAKSEEPVSEELEKHLWKPADGDDLPEIDREVIALLNNGKVVFAHRPYKGKYIGKNLTTGNIETFENKTYDKGCWNQPDIRWWLDAKLPKEIEL